MELQLNNIIQAIISDYNHLSILLPNDLVEHSHVNLKKLRDSNGHKYQTLRAFLKSFLTTYGSVTIKAYNHYIAANDMAVEDPPIMAIEGSTLKSLILQWKAAISVDLDHLIVPIENMNHSIMVNAYHEIIDITQTVQDLSYSDLVTMPTDSLIAIANKYEQAINIISSEFIKQYRTGSTITNVQLAVLYVDSDNVIRIYLRGLDEISKSDKFIHLAQELIINTEGMSTATAKTFI